MDYRAQAAILAGNGYRRVSNSGRIVARLDPGTGLYDRDAMEVNAHVYFRVPGIEGTVPARPEEVLRRWDEAIDYYGDEP